MPITRAQKSKNKKTKKKRQTRQTRKKQQTQQTRQTRQTQQNKKKSQYKSSNKSDQERKIRSFRKKQATKKIQRAFRKTDKCAICLDRVLKNANKYCSNLHNDYYHNACIKNWIDRGNINCPICRKQIITNFEPNIDFSTIDLTRLGIDVSNYINDLNTLKRDIEEHDSYYFDNDTRWENYMNLCNNLDITINEYLNNTRILPEQQEESRNIIINFVQSFNGTSEQDRIRDYVNELREELEILEEIRVDREVY